MEERIRTYLDQNPGEGISVRELKENIDVNNNTEAGPWNRMRER